MPSHQQTTQPQSYVYSQNAKDFNATRHSAMGRGHTADHNSTERNEVLDGVKRTLLNRMVRANLDSQLEAATIGDRLENQKKSTMDLSLKRISSFQQEGKDLIAIKKAEENMLAKREEDAEVARKERDAAKNDYDQASSRENLATKRAYERSLMADAQTRMDAYDPNANMEKLAYARSIRKNLKAGSKEAAEVEAIEDSLLAKSRQNLEDKRAVDTFNQHHKHSADDRAYLEKVRQRAKKAQETAASKKATYDALSRTASSAENDVIGLKAAVAQREKMIAENKEKIIEETFRLDEHYDKWQQTRKQELANAKYRQYYQQYDDAAMKYYVLTRTKGSNGINAESITGAASKDIREYVGNITEQQYQSQRLNFTLGQSNSFKITSPPNPNTRANIKSHKKITAQWEKKGIAGQENTIQKGKLDMDFHSVGKNAGKTQDMSLSVDKTTESGELLDSRDMFRIETMVSSHWKGGRRQNVQGVWLNDEFVSANDSIYADKKDAGLGYGRKVSDRGEFKKDAELINAIRLSPYFNHIYSENIEYYMSYPENDLVDSSPGAGPASLSFDTQANAVNSAFLDATPDEKAQCLYSLFAQSPIEQSALDNVLNFIKAHDLRDTLVTVLKSMLSNQQENIMQEGVRITKAYLQTNSSAQQPAAPPSTPGASVKDHAYQLLCLLVISKSPSTASQMWSKVQNFFLDEGEKTGISALDGTVNFGQMQEIYDSLMRESVNLATGRTKRLGELEDLLESTSLGDDERAKLESEKTVLEKQASHGGASDYIGLFTSILSLINAFKSGVEYLQNGAESDEYAQAKLLQDKYVTKMDNVFEGLSILVDLADSVFSILSFKPLEDFLPHLDPASKVWNTVKHSFNIAKHIYYIVQKSRKQHAIQGAEKTITGAEQDPNSQMGRASLQNQHLKFFMASARRYNAKSISEDVTETVVSSMSIASEYVDPVSSTILNVVGSGIKFFAKLIGNKIYNWREQKGAVTAALGDPKYYDYPHFDSILKEYTGINGRSHLAQVSRIFTAIDTHVLLRGAPPGSPEEQLAKTAMSAFYNVDGPSGTNIRKIPLSALLGQVGEGENWRSRLAAAIR